MTCASCAARIEKRSNTLDGVEAAVNFATEQASVRCDPGVDVAALVGAVESAGYHAQVAEGHRHDDEPSGVLARRLAIALALALPVALIAMIPALRFAGWERVPLGLSTPVVF